MKKKAKSTLHLLGARLKIAGRILITGKTSSVAFQISHFSLTVRQRSRADKI